MWQCQRFQKKIEINCWGYKKTSLLQPCLSFQHPTTSAQVNISTRNSLISRTNTQNFDTIFCSALSLVLSYCSSTTIVADNSLYQCDFIRQPHRLRLLLERRLSTKLVVAQTQQGNSTSTFLFRNCTSRQPQCTRISLIISGHVSERQTSLANNLLVVGNSRSLLAPQIQ